MDGVSEDDLCWLQLDDFRMLLIKTIDPSRITPYLRQCQVISAEDEEQLFNDPTLVIRRRKVGALLDILQRTGVKGYTAFLESLELDYPQLYSRITGKEPNKTFSILIDTAGESGLTQFLMSELSRLQRALQDERRRRQQACSAAKDQVGLQLRERELKKLTERLQKIRDERERLSEEVKQLRDHNYSLMADINSLTQEKSNTLLANRDLQIEVERLKHTVMRAENQTRLLRRRTLRPLQESLEEKEELELRCAQLKGDKKIYRQQNKQILRQLEEVIRERDKALSSQAEKHEEARILLQEKDQYREHVRKLTEQTDRLEVLLLRSQGEELQLRTRLRRITSNSHQVRSSWTRVETSDSETLTVLLRNSDQLLSVLQIPEGGYEGGNYPQRPKKIVVPGCKDAFQCFKFSHFNLGVCVTWLTFGASLKCPLEELITSFMSWRLSFGSEQNQNAVRESHFLLLTSKVNSSAFVMFAIS
uniref:Caspase recruitment domain family, member 9 n=1 Tax=Amphilophus citrinellus TaxID=61819 RepID=A0A3Q0RLX6_AMPCI